MKVKCPTCEKEITWSEAYPDRPFCSHRCKLIDLGEWASENRSIPGATNQIDEWDLDSEDALSDQDKLH